MTTFRKFNKVTTAVLCAGLIGAATGVLAPAAEANNHHQERRIRRQIRRDVRDFNRYQRAYNRDWRRARRVYNREVYGYPPVIPVYGYNHYRNPGFGIQLRF